MILYSKQIKLLKYWKLKNIRNAIKDFNEDERDVCSTYTNNKGNRNSNFITEKNYIVLLHNQENL